MYQEKWLPMYLKLQNFSKIWHLYIASYHLSSSLGETFMIYILAGFYCMHAVQPATT